MLLPRKQLPLTWRPLSREWYEKLDHQWNTASTYVLIAQTHPEKGHKGINAFIVDRILRAFRWVLMKINGMRSSDTHSVMFTDVKVPKENVWARTALDSSSR